jgi:hypothetical protein
MIQKNQLILLLLVLLAIVPSFAQTSEEEREKDAQRDKEILKKLNERPLRIADLNSLVPSEQNSWLVSIIVHEGWGDTSKIAATIKSDGNFLCRNENLLQNHPVNAADFTYFNGFFDNFNLKPIPNDAPVTECKTCTVETLQVSRRTKKNKVRTYIYNMDKHESSLSPIRQMYDAAKNVSKCE